jgi:delta-aminolevulinic acid dehydratase/porphobilinogen synthase
MDPANVEKRSARSRSTSTKGADIVMVKPALSYLDVIAR